MTMTVTNPSGYSELKERLRERDAAWQSQVDGWLSEAERLGQPATPETEQTIRDTIYDQALAAITTLEARIAQLEAGKDELLRLMDSIWRAEYRTEAPLWQPLPDLVGMVTQIDNMYAGVRDQRDEARAALENANG